MTDFTLFCYLSLRLGAFDLKFRMFILLRRMAFLFTVSPPREATWHITEGDQSCEFTNCGLCSENVFHMAGKSGL